MLSINPLHKILEVIRGTRRQVNTPLMTSVLTRTIDPKVLLSLFNAPAHALQAGKIRRWDLEGLERALCSKLITETSGFYIHSFGR